MNIRTCTNFCPGGLWPDNNGIHINAHGGGVLFHDGIYYWFGEHKIEGEAGNLAHVGVHVYSSIDLYNWRDEGIALAVSNDSASEVVRGCILERPKVIFNRATGKFVMWFHLEPEDAGYSSARSGLAISDKAIGPYQFLRSLRPNAGAWPKNIPVEMKRPLEPEEMKGVDALDLGGAPRPYYPRHSLFRRDFNSGQMARDMALFVDGDGSAYHIYASEENGTLHISRLSDDYLSSSGSYIRIFPGGFNEAPAIFKARGTYFLITSGCTGWAPNMARISVAENIFGPWEELGSPCLGNDLQTATTFNSQSSFVLPLHGRKDAFIFMADRWNPKNAIDGRYVWLPIEFRHGAPMFRWHDEWTLSFFDNQH